MVVRLFKLSVMVIALTFCASQSFAYDFNFDFINNTGQPQHGFRIKLQGAVTVTNFYTGYMNPFGEGVVESPMFTVITFSGAVVAPGDTIHIGFDVDDKTSVEKYGEAGFAAEWLDENGVPTEAVPVGGCWYIYEASYNRAAVYINNDTGPDSITVYDFCYYLPSSRIPLNNLMWNWITWTPFAMGPVNLDPGEVIGPFHIDGVSEDDYVVFGWKAIWWGFPTSEVRAVFQEQALRDAVSCNAAIISQQVPSINGNVVFDLEVANNGGGTIDVYAELYPTIGDCSSPSVFDFNINRLVVSNLAPGATFSGHYFYNVGNVSGYNLSQCALNFDVGPAIDDWLGNCCDEFRFYNPWGKAVSSAPNLSWGTEWYDRIDDVDAMPLTTSLGDNYPNPFNASTIIPYNAAVAGNVKLVIYNLSGQVVETVVDGYVEAGRHTVTWDASNYSSGIYFYKLQAGDYITTRKMNLLK